MSDTLTAAFVGGGIALIVALLTNFGAEIYRRHRDARGVAAAIAGELASYEPAWPILLASLHRWKVATHTGRRGRLAFRPYERPTDLIIDKVVEKLGLLDVDQVEAIAYVYGNIRASRIGIEILIRDQAQMNDEEFLLRVEAVKESIDRAVAKGVPLVKSLRKTAQESFWMMFSTSP